MTFDVPTQVTFNLEANCPNQGRTDVSVRHHTVVTDEPTHRGGTDAGAAPLETMLSSYLGCTNVILNMLAEEKSLRIDDLWMALTADMDTNGISTQAPTALPFPAMNLTVRAASDASAEQIADLKADLARRCPVSVVFRAAGTQITETWDIRPL